MKSLQKNGYLQSGKQRWRCISCGHSFTRKRLDKKLFNESVWFKRWIKGSYTVQSLIDTSGYSRSKLQRIILRNLDTFPPKKEDFNRIKYIVFDGKYLFGRKYCLLTIINSETHKPISGIVAKAENQRNMIPWLQSLKTQGLDPIAVTTDGKHTAITAFKKIWPRIITQRCLFHIKLQIQAWVRFKPRYDSSKAILNLVSCIDRVKNKIQIKDFQSAYLKLTKIHKYELSNFDIKHPIQSDTLRAYSLLKNAIPHCFYYLDNSMISSTSSVVEGYFKQIQRIKGFDHCGLTEKHLINFLAWRLYFDS